MSTIFYPFFLAQNPFCKTLAIFTVHRINACIGYNIRTNTQNQNTQAPWFMYEYLQAMISFFSRPAPNQ